MKYSLFTFVSIFITLSSMNISFSKSYQTLPKGVRNFVFKYVTTDSISSSYGNDGQEFQYSLKQNLNAKTLEDVASFSKVYFDELKRIDPEAYDAFSFGEYEGAGHARVQVQGYGLAYGITNKFTVYIAIPHYQADVQLNITRTKGKEHNKVSAILNQHRASDDTASLWSQLTKALPDASGGVIQSLIVKTLKYKPLGGWKAKGLGDIDLAGIFRLTDFSHYGAALTTGITIPTGRIDDPDLLQDFGFGDGQFDVFTELNGGFSLFNHLLNIDASTRFTYQFSSTKTLRVPNSGIFTISPFKKQFKEKLGNKVDLSFKATIRPTNWFSFHGEYINNFIARSNYQSSNSLANTLLARNTQIETTFIKAGIDLTSIELYKSGIIPLPLTIEISGKTMIRGKNTPKYTRYDFGIKFFF